MKTKRWTPTDDELLLIEQALNSHLFLSAIRCGVALTHEIRELRAKQFPQSLLPPHLRRE